jgi:hypothetical protein
VTIFDYIKDIAVTKSGDLPLDHYNPYIINRWLSFMNPAVATALTKFNSKIFLENKEIHYKSMLMLFPKMKHCPRITYVKKKKETVEQQEDKRLKAIAETLEISKREVLEFFGK